MKKSILKFKVTTKEVNDRLEFICNDGFRLGTVEKDTECIGRYIGKVLAWRDEFAHNESRGLTYTDAVEFVSDVLERRFKMYGKEIEFVTEN